MSATVIIPTTGTPELRDAIESVINQTYDTICYVVCDGEQHKGKVKTITDDYLGTGKVFVSNLPINVGSNGFYGHRVYAAFTHLVNTKYVLYLDQDCTLDEKHVEYCVKSIEEGSDQDWSYSLRNITKSDGSFICKDDCESLGQWPVFSGDYQHIDTNCYCIKTEVAVKLAQVWHGGWGQDRVFFNVLSSHFPRFACTGYYTVNYRLGGNEGSVKSEFFDYGNKIMNEKYYGVFPWRKRT